MVERQTTSECMEKSFVEVNWLILRWNGKFLDGITFANFVLTLNARLQSFQLRTIHRCQRIL